MDYTVFDRITLNSSPHFNIVWSHGRKTLKYIVDNKNSLQDVSQKIKQRAIAGYGLKDELWRNGELVDDETLSNVWSWLHLSGKLVEDGVIRGQNSKHPGVKSVLKIENNSTKSEVISISWSELGNTNCHGSARTYKYVKKKSFFSVQFLVILNVKN